MAASAPGSGPTGLGDVTFEQLGSYSVSQDGAKITVEGELSRVEWPEFSDRESDRTGYYLTLLLSGDEGAYVGQGSPGFSFQAFKSREDAEARRDGTAYEVDMSGVSYGS